MKKTLVCVILAFSFLLGGCSWFSGKPGPITLVDDFDREVTLAEPAQRVVSLVPATTEIMFALGHGDRVVGASDFCNYPEAALAIPRVGGFDVPDLETIVSLEPDLVLAASLHKETVEGLEGLGIPVLALDPMTFEEIYANISLVAKALGEEKAGEDLVADMQGRLEAVAQALGDLKEEERPLVFYESWYPGIWTAGEDTFIDEIIARAGGKNLAWGISRWVEMQEEEVLARNPDIIIHGYPEPLPVEPFAQRAGWDVVTAVQQEKIFFVNPDITSRTGPRVVDAVEELARFFHPDRFE
ncbi:MAG: helical backbone metal receptor [Bacillota bacterium]|jgi:iron complex transport system substrate-binding protein